MTLVHRTFAYFVLICAAIATQIGCAAPAPRVLSDDAAAQWERFVIGAEPDFLLVERHWGTFYGAPQKQPDLGGPSTSQLAKGVFATTNDPVTDDAMVSCAEFTAVGRLLGNTAESVDAVLVHYAVPVQIDPRAQAYAGRTQWRLVGVAPNGVAKFVSTRGRPDGRMYVTADHNIVVAIGPSSENVGAVLSRNGFVPRATQYPSIVAYAYIAGDALRRTSGPSSSPEDAKVLQSLQGLLFTADADPVVSGVIGSFRMIFPDSSTAYDVEKELSRQLSPPGMVAANGPVNGILGAIFLNLFFDHRQEGRDVVLRMIIPQPILDKAREQRARQRR